MTSFLRFLCVLRIVFICAYRHVFISRLEQEQEWVADFKLRQHSKPFSPACVSKLRGAQKVLCFVWNRNLAVSFFLHKSVKFSYLIAYFMGTLLIWKRRNIFQLRFPQGWLCDSFRIQKMLHETSQEGAIMKKEQSKASAIPAKRSWHGNSEKMVNPQKIPGWNARMIDFQSATPDVRKIYPLY